MYWLILFLVLVFCIFLVILFTRRKNNVKTFRYKGIDFIPAISRKFIYTPSPIRANQTGTNLSSLIHPRRMWGWGAENQNMVGYCGEMSVQTAGLYFGNYVSQGLINIASGGVSLVLGTKTAENACIALKYNFKTDYLQTFSLTSFRSYLNDNLGKGFPIIMGWFDWLDDTSDPDYQFNHIVIIVGYDSPSDTIYYNDHYLLETSTGILSDMFQTRKQCNSDADIIPQPLIYCVPKSCESGCSTDNCCTSKSSKCNCNYSLIIAGNIGTIVYPISLTVDRPDEPDWGKQDNLGMVPIGLNFVATIYNLISGVSYTLFRYGGSTGTSADYQNIPTTNFKNSQYLASYIFTANNPTQIIKGIDIVSNLSSKGAHFYRCDKN